MEQEVLLKEILNALKLHSEHVDKKLDQMNSKMDNMRTDLESKMDNMIEDLESKMDKGFNHLGKKVDGVRADLSETQETTDYVLSKTAQHEKKLRQSSEQ